MELEEWLNNNTLGMDIWKRKYQFEDEDLDSWFNRVSGGDEDVKRLIMEKKFLFGGRILANRGTQNNRKISLNNCYVLAKPEDNIESLYDTAKYMARTFSYSGGVGISLDNIAPRGAKVNNSAKSSSGVVSFCDLYNTTGSIIGSEGRRAALMLSLSSEHPDIEEFIDAKTDINELTKCNMSVTASDEYMNAVVSDSSSYKTSFDRDTGEHIEKYIYPSKVFDKLAYNNWQTGEPGLLMWDRVKNWTMLSEHPEFEFAGINPCQPLGEFVNTPNGFVKIEDVTNGVFLNGNNYNSSSCIFSGEKEVFLVTLENGIEIRMTGNHKISTPYGDKELQTLTIDDKVCMDYTPVYNTTIEDEDEYERGIIAGWFIADGGFSSKRNDVKHSAAFAVGKDEFEYKDKLTKLIIKHIDSEFHLVPHHQKPDTCMVGRLTAKASIQSIKDILKINSWEKFDICLDGRTKEFKLGFLRAVFTCDGSVRTNEYALICSIEKEFIRTIQRLLMEFGVYSTLTLHNNPKSYIAIDGKQRNNKRVWKVGIYDKVFNLIGFLTEYKQQYMLNKPQTLSKRIEIKKKHIKIRNIHSIGIMPVYDISVVDVHHYNSSGLIIHNCGEMPLPAFGACCLSSFNLSAYVKAQDNPGEYYFDMDGFRSDIPIVIRTMNNVLDEGLLLHPLKEQSETVAKWRQIGVGICGFSSALMKLHIKYGSEESIKLAKEIAEILLNDSILASTQLAKEFGPYPAYNYEYIKKSKFYQENVWEAYKEEVEKYGLRNSQLLSIAPTGSISLALSVSQSAEPLFSVAYNRRTESLYGESVSYKVYDPTVAEIMKELNITDEVDLPDYVITSEEIPYINRIKMQAAWQQYIDASISSTINLPNSSTVEDIRNIYIEAWKAGLKGITVYRAGCAREGILTTDTAPSTPLTNELKRGDWKPLAPDTTYDPKIKLKTGCGELELFPGWSPTEQRFQEIWIKKLGDGGCGKSIDAIAIEMSAIFRLGGSLENVTKALNKLGVCPSFKDARKAGKRLSKGNSCADCILKALQKFEADRKQEHIEEEYEEGTLHVTNACPECGAELMSTGGCFTCGSCGYSRCS